jgi:hypothetical protein
VDDFEGVGEGSELSDDALVALVAVEEELALLLQDA